MNKKKVSVRGMVIVFLMGIVLVTSGSKAFAAMQFSNNTHYWATNITAFGSSSEYWHRTRQHSATVKKHKKISSQSRSANWVAVGRIFEFSGCNYYYSNW